MSEKTADDVRDEFMSHLAAMVSYWNGLPDKTPLEKMNGVVFSVLAALDGVACLPAFIVAPCPHPEDRAYLEEQEEDWYPENRDGTLRGEITQGVMLHELWHKYEPKR